MLDVSTKPQESAAVAVQRLDSAAYQFGLDHNARRMPAAVAATMAGPQFPMAEALPYLEKCLINDPHARDLRAQIGEARKIVRSMQ